MTLASGLGLLDEPACAGVRTVSSDAQYTALCEGRADLVVTAMDNVIAWNRRAGPADFRIVAQVERTTPLGLYARPGLDSLAGLRGGIALVDAPGNGFVVAMRALLADAGLGPHDVALLPAGGVGERLEALLRARGDFTLLGPPFDAMAQEAGLACLATVQDAYRAFPGQGLVLRAGSIARLRPRLAPWLTALDEAVRRAGHGDPAALAHPGAALMPRSLLPDRSGVELLVAMRRRLGLPGGETHYDALVDTSFLPDSRGTARQ